MPNSRQKVILSACLIIFLLAFSLPVFAAEWRYPFVPGIGELRQAETLPKDQRLGFYVRYAVRLIFFIVLGVCIIVLLVAGVLYISAGDRVVQIITAKTMVQRAFLGLLILTASYLVLYAINPQLLIFQAKLPKIGAPPAPAFSLYPPSTVVFEQAPVIDVLREVIDKMSEKVFIDQKGRYYEEIDGRFCLTDGYKNLVDGAGATTNECKSPALILSGQNNFLANLIKKVFASSPQSESFVYRGEIPLRNIERLIARITEIIDGTDPEEDPGLARLLGNCRCGKSNFHADFEWPRGVCKPGKDIEELKKEIGEDGVKNLIINYQQYKIYCQGVGTETDKDGYPLCDLRNVRRNPETNAIEVEVLVGFVNNKEIKEWKTLPGPGSPGKSNFENTYKLKEERLIKYKILQLLEVYNQLEAQKRMNWPEQVSSLAGVLNINKVDYLAQQAVGLWGSQTTDLIERLQENPEINIVIQPYEKAEETSPLLTTKPSRLGFWQGLKKFFASSVFAQPAKAGIFSQIKNGTFYFITHAPENIQERQTTEKNQTVAREAGRISLFSVLTGLSLEEIEKIFKGCLEAAFGKAEYLIQGESINNALQSAEKEGLTEHLKSEIAKKIDENSQTFSEGSKEAISNDVNRQFISQYLNQCKSKKKENEESPCSQDKKAEDILNDLKKGCGPFDACCACVKTLKEDGIPPHFVSNLVSRVFTYNLEDIFPSIKNLLETELQGILIAEDSALDKFFDKELIEIYQGILPGAFRSFAEIIPSLEGILTKKMKDVLPEFARSNMRRVEGWLKNRIELSRALIKNYSEDFIKGLGRNLLVDPIHKWAEEKRREMGVSLEDLSVEECYQHFREGLVFKPEDGGKCVKMTPEEINQLGNNHTLAIPSGTDSSGALTYAQVDKSSRSAICQRAGYTWLCSYEGKTKSKGLINGGLPKQGLPEVFIEEGACSCVYQDELIRDVKGAAETAQDFDKLKDKAKITLINFAEGFITALIETAMHTAIEYAKVFIEDHFVAPFLLAFNTISGFQEGLGNFLEKSVAEILPDQIANILQSNINAEIENLCSLYKQAKAELEAHGPLNPETKIEIIIKTKLPEGKTWDITWNEQSFITTKISISQKRGEQICQLSEHLKATVIEELAASSKLGEKIAEALRSSIKDNLCRTEEEDGLRKNVCEWLEKPLASLIWEDVYGVDQLIKGTPQKLVCGELFYWDTSKKQGSKNKAGSQEVDSRFALVSSGSTTFKDQCFSIIKSGGRGGVLPFLDYDKAQQTFGFFGQADEARDLVLPWCFFIASACRNPFADFIWGEGLSKNTLGGLIKEIFQTICAFSDFKDKWGCKFAVQKSLGFTIFKIAIEADFGPPELMTQEQKKNEEDTYKWMLVYFPKLESEIKEIAFERGFGAKWDSITNEVLKKDFFPEPKWKDWEGWLRKLVQWRLYGEKFPSVKDFLLDIPDGVVKPFKPGDPTLLKEANQGEPQNFLAKTPFQLLELYCKKVKNEFERLYPGYTFEALQQEGWLKFDTALPYSMQSVDMPTTAKTFRAIADLRGVDQNLRQAYLFCKSLRYTPAEILGLDQPLKSYIRPKEYIILFDLLKYELREGDAGDCRTQEILNETTQEIVRVEEEFRKNQGKTECCDPGTNLCRLVGERPPSLNRLLDYLYNKTPITALLDIKSDVKNNPSSLDEAGEENKTKELIEPFISFMATPLGEQIKNALDKANQRIIDLICASERLKIRVDDKEEKSLCDLYWDQPEISNKIQTDFLKKTPIDLVADYLTQPITTLFLTPEGRGASIMDLLAENSVLGQRIIDTVARWLNWDKPLFKGANAVDNWVEKGIEEGVQAVQRGLEVALLEWPTKAGKRLAEILGLELGKNTSQKIAGKCRDVKDANQCQSGEVARLSADKTQCCDLGGAFACFSRCRLKPDGGSCDELIGESESQKHFCCEKNNPQNCRPKPISLGEGCSGNEHQMVKEVCCFTNSGSSDYDYKEGAKNYCEKCRPINKNAGAQCRMDPKTNKKLEDEKTKTVVRKNKSVAYPVCCRQEVWRQSVDEAVDECCTTVLDCVSYKLASHLELLAEMVADGNLPLRSLK